MEGGSKCVCACVRACVCVDDVHVLPTIRW